MRRIKTGDDVIVIAGKDKGKQGRVVRVLDDRVVVENINLAKRHTKGNPMLTRWHCTKRNAFTYF